jgi:hypothetical protein
VHLFSLSTNDILSSADSNVTIWRGMFAGASSFTVNQDKRSWIDLMPTFEQNPTLK